MQIKTNKNRMIDHPENKQKREHQKIKNMVKWSTKYDMAKISPNLLVIFFFNSSGLNLLLKRQKF